MQVCNFEGAHPVGKPADWVPELDGDCGVIFCIDHLDERLGANWKFSLYKPSPADLACFNAGGGMRLGIMCPPDGHPVFNLLCMTQPIIEELKAEPLWDMAPPYGQPAEPEVSDWDWAMEAAAQAAGVWFKDHPDLAEMFAMAMRCQKGDQFRDVIISTLKEGESTP